MCVMSKSAGSLPLVDGFINVLIRIYGIIYEKTLENAYVSSSLVNDHFFIMKTLCKNIFKCN